MKDSSMPPAEQSDTPGESTPPPRRRPGRGTPPRRMDPAPTPTQAQTHSPRTKANPRWSPRLGPPPHRRAPTTPPLPPRENFPAAQEAQANQKQDSQKPGAASKEPETVSPSKENQIKKKATPSNTEKTEKQAPKKKRTLKSLRDFPLPEFFPKWYRDLETSIFRQALTEFGIKNNIDGLVIVIHTAADLIHNLDLGEDHFIYNLSYHFKRYFQDNPGGPEITIEKFDDYLYRWAMKVCSRAFDIIHERERAQYKPV